MHLIKAGVADIKESGSEIGQVPAIFHFHTYCIVEIVYKKIQSIIKYCEPSNEMVNENLTLWDRKCMVLGGGKILLYIRKCRFPYVFCTFDGLYDIMHNC